MRIDDLLSRLKGTKASATGWTALCPAHDDHDASLSIAEGEEGRILLKCFAGCTAETIVRCLDLELKDLFPETCSRATSSTAAQEPQRPGLSLKELAAAKKLPVEFLLGLGLRDCTYTSFPAVRIPYFGLEGEVLAVRFRLSMSGHQRFTWRSGDKVSLYGLDRLKDVQKLGWVLLLEGESDSWTAWHHGLPALGVPGKSTWREGWGSHLAGLRVYLWQEPDAEDLTARVRKDVPGLMVITAPAGTKDISEAHLQGADVPALIDALKAQGIPAERICREDQEARVSELRKAAAVVLEAPDPLVLVRDAIARLGYGGDLRQPLIVYLAATSRLLAMRTGSMPVHLLLLGAPSAGKSYTLKLVLRLLPASAYHVIDAGSPRVLIYDSEDLRHRVTVFSEADSLPAGEDNPAASAIRGLLQDHYLHYKLAVRDPQSGDFVVREVDKPGPTVLVTTAVKRLGAQLDSRLFSLEVPEDHQHVLEALRAQASLEVNGACEPDPALIAFQEYLQALAPWDVVVPYVDILGEAVGKSLCAPRILRDFQRLVSLVKALTVLRHARRERDSGGRLVATVEEYRGVFELVAEMYEASASGASKRTREVVEAVASLQAQGEDPVTVSLLATRLGLHRSSVSRHVGVALRAGWLCNTQKEKGRPLHLILGEELPSPSGLPAPGGCAVSQPIPAAERPPPPPVPTGWEEGEI